VNRKALDILVYSLITLFIALNVVDLVLTATVLNMGDGKEANPYLSHYNVRGVTWLDAVFKVMIACLIGYCLHRLYEYCLRDDSSIAEILIFITLTVSNVYYVYVVTRNLQVLLR